MVETAGEPAGAGGRPAAINRPAAAGLTLLALMAALAAIGPLVSPYAYDQQTLALLASLPPPAPPTGWEPTSWAATP